MPINGTAILFWWSLVCAWRLWCAGWASRCGGTSEWSRVRCCWAGLRPGSPDGLPFLGPVPGLANLLVAAGHFRAGILLSPITGLVLKELLLGDVRAR